MSVHRSISEPDDGVDEDTADTSGPEEQESTPDNQTLIRLLEEQEKVIIFYAFNISYKSIDTLLF